MVTFSVEATRPAKLIVVKQVSLIRAYIRPKRPLRTSRATVRFETGPGQQLQHDWGEVWTEIGARKGQPHAGDSAGAGGARVRGAVCDLCQAGTVHWAGAQHPGHRDDEPGV